MEGITIILFFIFIFFYIFSALKVCNIFSKKSVPVNTFSVLMPITPILNTFIVLKYGKFIDFTDLKEIFQQLNKK